MARQQQARHSPAGSSACTRVSQSASSPRKEREVPLTSSAVRVVSAQRGVGHKLGVLLLLLHNPGLLTQTLAGALQPPGRRTQHRVEKDRNATKEVTGSCRCPAATRAQHTAQGEKGQKCHKEGDRLLQVPCSQQTTATSTG